MRVVAFVLRTFVLASIVVATVFTGTLANPADQSGPVFAPLGSDLGAISETVRLPRATWYNDRDGDKVFDSLEEKFATLGVATLPVIVTFRYATDVEAALARVQEVAGPVEPTHVYRTLGGFAAPLTASQAVRIAALDEVRQVEWSQPGEPELDTATVHMGARAVQQHLGISGDLDGLPNSFTGRDITIGILDTGFDGEHVDLAGKFLAFFDWQDRKLKEPYDSGNHGTHVASIAGGLGLGKTDYTGVAPGASFVGMKITGGDTKANAIGAMDWLISNKTVFNIRISTISFGFGLTVDGTDALELAMDRAFEAGILPFKSNGNSGPEESTTTIPGGARGIVSVGSMLDPGRPGPAATGPVPGTAQQVVSPADYGFRISTYSSRGPTADNRIKPDVAAPGQAIMAASKGTKTGYVALSGTSMASPFAAGTAALIMAADPKLTNAQVRDILFQTAEDWGPKGPDIDYGHGRINVLLAVQTALIGRLAREGAPLAELQRVANVPGPVIPFHAAGSLTGQYAERNFNVQDAKQPLAVTVLYTGFRAPTASPARALVVEIISPGDVVVGRLSLTPVVRQQVIAFVPPTSGSYNIRVVNPTLGGTVGYDVSAGLPPPAELPGVELPNATQYEERIGSAKKVGRSQEDAQTPGLAGAGVIMAVLGALLVARRGRQS